MPVSFLWLWSFLLAIVAPILTQIITSLGVGLVTFVGIDLLLNTVLKHAAAAFSAAPSFAVQIMGMAGFDKALNLIVSAYMIKLTFKGLKRPFTVWNPPGLGGRVF